MADDSGFKVEGPFVEKTPEGSNYELWFTVDGAKFPVGVIKSGEIEARIGEAADAEAEAKSTAKK